MLALAASAQSFVVVPVRGELACCTPRVKGRRRWWCQRTP